MKNTTTASLRSISRMRPLRLALISGAALTAVFSATAAMASEPREPAEVYDQVCAHCHDPAMGVGPVITQKVPESSREGRVSFIQTMVRHGNAAMPAFRKSEISDPELKALAEALASGEFAQQDGE